ncbi:MAG: fumarate reductase iron-sulfur subunit [Spirochaetes bacterium]|nr:fumarate reductase iron-sulfur subunit [Spirochaetota bacterium]
MSQIFHPVKEDMVKNRILKIEIMRFNPDEPDRMPFMQKYTVEEDKRISILNVLQNLRDNEDPTLRFDAVCRSAVCGSCAMMINGRPGLACRTYTSELPSGIKLHPLPFFKLIGDLSVDTGTWFRAMYERTESWIHSSGSTENLYQDNEKMKAVYDLDRCIECGCCAAGCATANMSDTFITAAGLLRAARFFIDPRDERTESQWYDVIGNDEGMFGCSSYLACNDYCPKNIPMQNTLAMLRRKMIKAGIFGKSR